WSKPPSSTGVHWPMWPGWSHDTQAPSQATLQQTPSAHDPDSHSLSFLKTAPRGFTPHMPSLQPCPSHWLAEVQAAKHSPRAALQAYGAHAIGGPSLQAPSSHWDAPTTALPSQWLWRQLVPSG